MVSAFRFVYLFVILVFDSEHILDADLFVGRTDEMHRDIGTPQRWYRQTPLVVQAFKFGRYDRIIARKFSKSVNNNFGTRPLFTVKATTWRPDMNNIIRHRGKLATRRLLTL